MIYKFINILNKSQHFCVNMALPKNIQFTDEDYKKLSNAFSQPPPNTPQINQISQQTPQLAQNIETLPIDDQVASLQQSIQNDNPATLLNPNGSIDQLNMQLNSSMPSFGRQKPIYEAEEDRLKQSKLRQKIIEHLQSKHFGAMFMEQYPEEIANYEYMENEQLEDLLTKWKYMMGSKGNKNCLSIVTKIGLNMYEAFCVNQLKWECEGFAQLVSVNKEFDILMEEINLTRDIGYYGPEIRLMALVGATQQQVIGLNKMKKVAKKVLDTPIPENIKQKYEDI